MNLSHLAQKVISDIGKTIAAFYTMQLTPLQIMILCEIRYRETKLAKGQYIYADEIRAEVAKTYEENGRDHTPSRQSFWVACNSLREKGLVYIAPPKKDTSKRSMMLTTKAADVFIYPPSIHPYRTQPKANQDDELQPKQ